MGPPGTVPLISDRKYNRQPRRLLQRSNLTTVEAFQFVKARTAKLHTKYLGEIVHWDDEVYAFIDSDEDINMAAILCFVESVFSIGHSVY